MSTLPEEKKIDHASPEWNEFYTGLQVLEGSTFPKKCCSCGRTYPSLDAFLSQTAAVADTSGLMAFDDGPKGSTVGMFRNCACGSTLLVPCADRREQTRDNSQRRQLFGRLLDILDKNGWNRDEARQELLKVMRGEPSRISQVLTKVVTDPARQA